MATAIGYRIGVDASKFCTNFKRYFYIYVDLLRDRIIQDIENRIKRMLEIDTSICLLNGSFYLPPSENVRLLCSGDILKVVKQCEVGQDLNESLPEVNENYEEIPTKKRKRRKKKHVHDTSENDSNKIDVESHCEAVNDHAKEEIAFPSNLSKQTEVDTLMTWNGANDNADEIAVASNLPKQLELDTSMTWSKYTKEDGRKVSGYVESQKVDTKVSSELSDLSLCSPKNMGKTFPEENDERDVLFNEVKSTKKRHRTRVRKSKKKQMPTISYLPIPPTTYKKEEYTPDKSRTHIRFDEDEDSDDKEAGKLNKSEMDSVSMVMDTSVLEHKSMFGNVHSTKWDVKNGSSNLTNGVASNGMINGTTEGTETFAKLLSFGKGSSPLVVERKRNVSEAISSQLPQAGNENNQISDISKYPKLQMLPKENDLIAFKMLKMDENYTPKISEYIIAKVLSVCNSTFQLSLQLLEGADECRQPKGKFDLEEAEDNEPTNRLLTINWNELYETRLLHP